jgi:hypothetical protein
MRLAAGGHILSLTVTDGKKSARVETIVTVPTISSSMERSIHIDPERVQQYPQKEFEIPIKGINYWSGNVGSKAFPGRPVEEIHEDLTVVRDELGCNAVQFRGGDELSLINCVDIATRIGFPTIIVNPFQIDQSLDERADIIKDLGSKVQTFHEKHKSIVLSMGDELSLGCKGILTSSTYEGRIQELRTLSSQDRKKCWPLLNSHLKTVLAVAREVFDGRLTYNSGTWEEVDWGSLDCDIIGINYFFRRQDEAAYSEKAREIKRLGDIMHKPFWVTATGCATFEDAYDYGGAGWQFASSKTYSQDAQARAIERIMTVLDKAGLAACFLANFKESKADDRTSYGILRFNGEQTQFSRKLAFYAYKSYVAT